MPDRDLNAMLDRQARQQPQAVAFRDPQRSWTFEQVQQASLRIGQGLRAAGIGPGERVACLTRHVVECTLLTLGAARIGAVCMPVNWRLAPNEVAYILANGGARFLMTESAARLPTNSSGPAHPSPRITAPPVWPRSRSRRRWRSWRASSTIATG